MVSSEEKTVDDKLLPMPATGPEGKATRTSPESNTLATGPEGKATRTSSPIARKEKPLAPRHQSPGRKNHSHLVTNRQSINRCDDFSFLLLFEANS
jgi:hypothetical protein